MATQKTIKEKDHTFIQDPCSVCLGMKEMGGSGRPRYDKIIQLH